MLSMTTSNGMQACTVYMLYFPLNMAQLALLVLVTPGLHLLLRKAYLAVLEACSIQVHQCPLSVLSLLVGPTLPGDPSLPCQLYRHWIEGVFSSRTACICMQRCMCNGACLITRVETMLQRCSGVLILLGWTGSEGTIYKNQAHLLVYICSVTTIIQAPHISRCYVSMTVYRYDGYNTKLTLSPFPTLKAVFLAAVEHVCTATMNESSVISKCQHCYWIIVGIVKIPSILYLHHREPKSTHIICA